jgi:hypothetical protein
VGMWIINSQAEDITDRTSASRSCKTCPPLLPSLSQSSFPPSQYKRIYYLQPHSSTHK